jgi:hypothetical protein
MRWVLRIALLAFVFGVGFTGFTPSATAADVGSFPSGTTGMLSGEGPSQQKFPITLAPGIRPKKVTARVVSATLDGVPATSIASMFSISWRTGLPGLLLAEKGQDLQPGTYAIAVKLNAPRHSQLITLTLLRKAASVRDIEPVAASVTTPVRLFGWDLPDALGWIGCPTLPDGECTSSADASDAQPIAIRLSRGHVLSRVEAYEVSNGPGRIVATVRPNIGLPKALASQLAQAKTPGALVVVLSTILNTSLQVPTGTAGSYTLHYRMEDMPLGTSVHVVALDAPELEQPVTVTFNVTARRPYSFLLVVIALGLLAGTGLRRVIDPSVSRFEAALTSATVAKNLGEETKRVAHNAKQASAQPLEEAGGRAPVPGGGATTNTTEADSQTEAQSLDALLAAPRMSYLTLAFANPHQVISNSRKAAAIASTSAQQPVRTSTGGTPPTPSTPPGPAKDLTRLEQIQIRVVIAILLMVKTVLLFTVATLIGYGVYQEGWVGSWPQLLAAFSWAFALDVTTSKLTALAAEHSSDKDANPKPDPNG